MLRTHEGKQVFSQEKKKRFLTALDLMRCLKQVKKTDIASTPISEIPYDISNMSRPKSEYTLSLSLLGLLHVKKQFLIVINS